VLNFEQLENWKFFQRWVRTDGQTSRTRVGSWPVIDPDLVLAGAAGSGSLETPTAV